MGCLSCFGRSCTSTDLKDVAEVTSPDANQKEKMKNSQPKGINEGAMHEGTDVLSVTTQVSPLQNNLQNSSQIASVLPKIVSNPLEVSNTQKEMSIKILCENYYANISNLSSVQGNTNNKHKYPITSFQPTTKPIASTLKTGRTIQELTYSENHQYIREYDRMIDEYRVIRKLSSGTCAVVLLGLNGVNGRKVAIKRQEKKGRSMLQIAREVNIHFRVCGSRHRNIAGLLEVAEGPSEVILIQEFCGGGELFDAVAPEVGCAHNVARSYIIQILQSLVFLHEECKIAHRDIKPENIMLTKDKKTIKLIDFGLAEQIQGPGARYKRRVGTVPYMDPILWVNKNEDGYGEIDIMAPDVWAAGVVLFSMLCGRFPWAEATNRSSEFRKYLSGEFGHHPWNKLGFTQVTLLQAMLNPNTKNRFTARQALAYCEANWPIITPKEHKDEMSSKLRILANGGQSTDSSRSNTPSKANDIIDNGQEKVINSILTLSPVPNVSNVFTFDSPHVVDRKSNVVGA